MPFCNWCQLDSDGGSSCVWCKRPFDDKPSVFNKRSDYQRLATEDEHIPTPYFAILGLVGFLGLAAVGYVVFRPKPAEADRKSLGWTVLPQQGQPPVSGHGALTNFSPPSVPVPDSGNFGWNPAPTNPMSGGGAGSISSTTYSGQQSTGHIRRVTLLADYDDTGKLLSFGSSSRHIDSFTQKLGVYVESVKFLLVRDKKGSTHLVGDVVVQNNMLAPLTDGRLWLLVSGMKYDLKPYDGSVNGPKWLPPFWISPRQSTITHVMAMGFQPWGPLTGAKQIGLDAKVASEPVHAEAEIKEATSESNQ